MSVKPKRKSGGRARAEDRETREQAILDAALDVFAEKGFAASRLDDVAARAGVAKGTIYLYFASKEALFEGLIRSSIVLPIEAVRHELLSRDLPAEASLRFLFAWMRRELLGTRRKEIVRLVLSEAGRFPALAEFYHREVVSRGMGLFREIAERAAARGEFSGDELARFPQLVIAPGLVAILWTWLFDRFEPLDTQGLLDAHLAVLMRALKGRES
jgi:AcrR family transcriptional regulator